MSGGIAAGSPLAAAANASARRIHFCRDVCPYQPFIFSSDHGASLSLWHWLQAFGMPWRMVFSGTGTDME